MKLKLSWLLLPVILLLSFYVDSEAVAGKEAAPGNYYTAVNIWWYKPMKIYSTNYHRGEMIPAGTRVKITDISSKRIYFTRKSDGKEFAILRMKRHTKLPVDAHVKRLFSKKNPKGAGSKYSRFTKKEKRAVKHGLIFKGMSRDAAIMAYGYPPDHKTPNLKKNLWIYYKGLYVSWQLRFKNGKTANSLH